MKTNFFNFLGFITVVVLLLGCNKNLDESCPVCHELKMSPQLTPMNKDYRVGDTVVLSLKVPFMQSHPDHFRSVNLAELEPSWMSLLFLYYEPVAGKTYYNRKSGYTVNQYEVLAGEDKGLTNAFSDYSRHFIIKKKSDGYELGIRIVLKQQGYFSIGARGLSYKRSNSPECFYAGFPFDTASNNNFIQPIVGFESTTWPEDYFFRVQP